MQVRAYNPRFIDSSIWPVASVGVGHHRLSPEEVHWNRIKEDGPTPSTEESSKISRDMVQVPQVVEGLVKQLVEILPHSRCLEDTNTTGTQIEELFLDLVSHVPRDLSGSAGERVNGPMVASVLVIG